MSTPERAIRMSADLVESATSEGARQGRSAMQQLDHWARVGRAVSERHTAARRRVEAALADDLPQSSPSDEEGLVFNAEVTAGLEESLLGTNFGEILRAQGITTVALDDHGAIVEYRPGGTSAVVEVLDAPPRRVPGERMWAVDRARR